jgi:uncharacterized protein (TIGR03083 family)
MDEPFAVIAAERRALADTLETLTPEQWATPSLCGDWLVKDVAAHLLVGPTASMREFVVTMATSRLDFDKANRRLTARRADRPTSEIVALVRRHADSRFTPPGQDWHSPLMDLFIHRLDCLVPLGIPADRPLDPWRHILDHLVEPGTQRLFTRRPAPGVTLIATDVDWSHGSGPEVTGTAETLGLALAGRRAGLAGLSGPGMEVLSAWLTR